jgi:hypothetical protein
MENSIGVSYEDVTPTQADLTEFKIAANKQIQKNKDKDN